MKGGGKDIPLLIAFTNAPRKKEGWKIGTDASQDINKGKR